MEDVVLSGSGTARGAGTDGAERSAARRGRPRPASERASEPMSTAALANGADERSEEGTASERASELRLMPVSGGALLKGATSLFSKDVYSYAAQAAMVLHHSAPYAHGPGDAPGFDSPLKDNVDEKWATTPAPYGPVFLVLAARM